jgi:TPR repeat protein
MAPNPLKPLIKGMFVMLAVAAVVLFAYFARLALIAEQERIAESQKRSKEINDGFRRKAVAEATAAKLRREQEAARAKETAERRAKEDASFAAAEAKKRPVDVGVAFGNARRSAEAGEADAQNLLGVIYHKGMDQVIHLDPGTHGMQFSPHVLSALTGEDLSRGSMPSIRFVSIPVIPANSQEAVRWLERAALQGHHEAQATLASLLFYTLQDPVTSYKWSLIADANPTASTDGKLDGHTPASRKLLRERSLLKLTQEQVAEAEKKAKAFVAKKEKP